MGSSEIWDQISKYNPPRLPFKQFVSNFLEKNGRFPRIAVDGYLWLFECGYFEEYANPSKIILNWLTKLKEMFHSQVLLVLVFDGAFKPDVKRQNDKKSKNLWESYWMMKTLIQNKLIEEKCIEGYILECCKLFNVPVFNAPGEGEAQCAYLQVTHQVDFVLSNDADVLLFGATKILKNYSKHGWKDLPNSGISPRRSTHNERFVTVIDLNMLQPWNRDRLLLFNLLVGGDYSVGVRHLGGKRAAALAKWDDPDISKRLPVILSGIKSNNKFKAAADWKNYGKDILKMVQEKSKEIFGMNLRSLDDLSEFENWPDVTVGLFYRYSIVSTVALPKIENEWEASSEMIDFMKANELQRFVNDFNKWYEEFLLHSKIVKYIRDHPVLSDANYKLTQLKTVVLCDGLYEMKEVCVRFKPFLETFIPSQHSLKSTPCAKSRTASPTRSPAKSTVIRAEFPNYVWIPVGLLPKPLLDDFEAQLHSDAARDTQASPRKSSARKKRASSSSPSPQLNTLDRYLKEGNCAIRNLTPMLQMAEEDTEDTEDSIIFISHQHISTKKRKRDNHTVEISSQDSNSAAPPASTRQLDMIYIDDNESV